MGPVPLIALGGFALLALSKRSGIPYNPVGDGVWVDADAPRRIRELAGKVINATGWYGLDDFLVAVAYWESRGNARACRGTCTGNVARGWFQGRPNSFLVHQFEGMNPSILFDEKWQVALAAWYAYRLRGFAFSGQRINWLAIRRGWAYPSHVDDVNEHKERSGRVHRNFEESLIKVGLNDRFMYEPAFPQGFDWPGIDVVLNAVGATRNISLRHARAA